MTRLPVDSLKKSSDSRIKADAAASPSEFSAVIGLLSKRIKLPITEAAWEAPKVASLLLKITVR